MWWWSKIDRPEGNPGLSACATAGYWQHMAWKSKTQFTWIPRATTHPQHITQTPLFRLISFLSSFVYMCNSVVPITIQWRGVGISWKANPRGQHSCRCNHGRHSTSPFRRPILWMWGQRGWLREASKAVSKHQPVSWKWSNQYVKKVHKIRFHWVIRWVTLRNNCLQIQHAFNRIPASLIPVTNSINTYSCQCICVTSLYNQYHNRQHYTRMWQQLWHSQALNH